MQTGPSLIERAFELAATGQFKDKTTIIEALKREGYQEPDEMLHGLTMDRHLSESIALGRRNNPAPRDTDFAE